jgi:Uma2 family endonuclease
VDCTGRPHSSRGIRPPRWSLEIVSPEDESWEKLPFCAAHGVDEVLIVDPRQRSVSWLGLKDGEYAPIERSGLVDLGAQDLAEQLDWPAGE